MILLMPYLASSMITFLKLLLICLLPLLVPLMPAHSLPTYQSFLGASTLNSFLCSDITRIELVNVVYGLKPSSTCIGSCISATLLKNCIESIAYPLLHIFNLSFSTGIFPQQLKLSRVARFLRKGLKP